MTLLYLPLPGGTGAGGGARQGAVVDIYAKPAQTSAGGSKGVSKWDDKAYPEGLSRAFMIVDFRDLANQVIEAVTKGITKI